MNTNQLTLSPLAQRGICFKLATRHFFAELPSADHATRITGLTIPILPRKSHGGSEIPSDPAALKPRICPA